MREVAHPFPPGSVVALTGIMGAGKSTVAQRLAERLPRAAHVRGDLFRRMIVTGRQEMTPAATAGALAQLRLRYDLAAHVADAYAAAGFVAIYQDIVLGDDLAELVRRIASRPLFVVVLLARADVIRARAEGRPKGSGYDDWTVEAMDDLLRTSPRLGLWLDTSAVGPDDTVDLILDQAGEAQVD